MSDFKKEQKISIIPQLRAFHNAGDLTADFLNDFIDNNFPDHADLASNSRVRAAAITLRKIAADRMKLRELETLTDTRILEEEQRYFASKPKEIEEKIGAIAKAHGDLVKVGQNIKDTVSISSGLLKLIEVGMALTRKAAVGF